MFLDGKSDEAMAPLVADTPLEMAQVAARLVVAWLAEPSGAAELSVCLAGGTSPRLLYQALSSQHAAQVPWDRLVFYFGDERCVAPDHPDSNYRMVCEALGASIAGRARIRPMYTGAPGATDAAEAAAAYQALLPPAFDLLLLGMGPDGHVCSLFPGHPALDERARRVVAIDDSPKPPPRRITITPPVIESARAVLVLVSGSEKAEAVARALAREGDIKSCPARLARGRTWMLDRAAASLLAAA